MKSLAHFLRDVAHAITRALVTDKVIDLDEARRAIADAALAPDFIEAPDDYARQQALTERIDAAVEHLRLEGVALDLARWDAECREAGL